ncbi:hypothetical protein [Gordonia alkaliphila]|uniref:Uncharacterized protein n=1 Tax=Gordonia alkaliphila TaxID=1053547 RepID=A0ABP8ZGY8_9ACTN
MTWPQEDHADLGLIDDDNTPEMRKTPVHSAKNATEVSSHNPTKGTEAMADPTLTTPFPALSGPILAIEEYLATDNAPVLVRVQVDDPIRGPIIEMYFADDLMVQP